MDITILVEPVGGNGFRACGGAPLPLSAEGATREEAIANLRKQVEDRLQQGAELVSLHVGQPSHPWLEFAGMFKDDPWIEDWKQSVAEYRQKVEDDPDAL